jgi:hypothetical protein
MKLPKILLIIVVGYGLTLSTCRGDLKSVTVAEYDCYIQNNSNDTFQYSISNLYPDTSIQNNLESYLIYPNQRHQIYIPVDFLPNFKTTRRVEIFLFNVDTLQKYSWPTVMAKYLVTKRYDLTYDSLMVDNNVINYP